MLEILKAKAVFNSYGRSWLWRESGKIIFVSEVFSSCFFEFLPAKILASIFAGFPFSV